MKTGGVVVPTAGVLAGATVLAASLARGGLPLHPSVIEHPWATLVVVLAGGVFAFSQRLAGLREAMSRILLDSSDRAFRTTLFLVGTLFFGCIALFLFDGLPRLADGVSSVFQARIFLRGRVTLPLPENAEFYDTVLVLGSTAGLGHWSGMYPPAWPALLVPGVLSGASWIVNPILGGSLAVAVTGLGTEIYGPREGRIAGLLTLLSPFVAVLSGTHLSHTATALFVTISALAVFRLLRQGGLRWGFLAGGALGVAFLCRPLTALVLGLVMTLVPLARWRMTLARWREVIAVFAMVIVAGGILAAFQNEITGDPFTPGHEVGMGSRGKFGFVQLDHARTHTPEAGAEHTLLRLRTLNDRLFGWPLPSLLLPLTPFLLGRARAREVWLLLPLLALLGVFSMFWYYESQVPARYTFAAMPFLLILAARGWEELRHLGRRLPGRLDRIPTAAAAASILFAAGVSHADYFERFGPDFGNVESVLPKVLEAYDVHQAIVFMDTIGRCTIRGIPLLRFYSTGFLRNAIPPEAGDVIFAHNMRRANHRLFEDHPDRDLYFYRYDRCRQKALLYRLVPHGKNYELVPLPPRIPEMVEAPPARFVHAE